MKAINLSESTIQCIVHYYNHLSIKPLCNISATGVDEIGDVLNQDEFLKQAYELGLTVGQERNKDNE